MSSILAATLQMHLCIPFFVSASDNMCYLVGRRQHIMRWGRIQHLLQTLLFRHIAESDLKEELTAHIELQARKHMAAGMNEEEARRRARIEFGGIETAREECREVDHWRWIDASTRNLKHCVRSLAKSPGFVLVFILILTVGIGSNLAVFSTMDALLLRPLPVERPNELVRILAEDRQGNWSNVPSTFLDALEGNRAFQGICGFSTSLLAAENDGNMRELGVASFSGSCFKTLGLSLQLGRPISAGDDQIGAQPVAVIADSLWRSAFGGRPDVLGKLIKVNGEIFTIVGVTERRFTGLLLGFPEPIMVPLRQEPLHTPIGQKLTTHWVNVLARRAAGISEAQARASVIAQKNQLLEQSIPQHYNAAQRTQYLAQELAVRPGESGVDYFLRDRFGKPLYALFGICAALLLIACVNLTSLLLARSLSRRREVGVRLALGARPGQIAAIFVLENTMLVLAGTILGVAAAFWTARTILAQGDQMFGNFGVQIGLDVRVLIFLAVAVGLALAMFAAASIWQARRLSSIEALKGSGRGVIATNSLAQKTLAGVQIALTLAFVSGSVLLGASLRHMYNIDFGIKPHNVWTAMLTRRPGPAGYRNFATVPYYRDLLEQIESLPGVVSASLSDFIPFFNGGSKQPIAILENAQPGREVQARSIGVSDGFFQTLGAKIVAGEDFRRSEDNSPEPGVILSRSLAQYLVANCLDQRGARDIRELLGYHLRVGNETEYQRLKITGIASDADLDLATPDDQKPFTVYVDFWQHRDLQFYPVLLVKTSGNMLSATALRRIVDGKGREYVGRVKTVDSDIDAALVENRMLAYLSGAFGALALGMAAVGLFGLLSYQVGNRTSEIGIRMALGAKQGQIRWLVLRQIVRLMLIGSLAGIALTFLTEKIIAGLLYGVGSYNIIVVLFAIVVLGATALAAAWIPIHRALGIDPIQALRHD
ncbi:MAG TPA: ABC transporter permease [Bryobacteraceae bacterium]|nr:ABC transporter permease [Bryobacteraceae bacterium]